MDTGRYSQAEAIKVLGAHRGHEQCQPISHDGASRGDRSVESISRKHTRAGHSICILVEAEHRGSFYQHLSELKTNFLPQVHKLIPFQ